MPDTLEQLVAAAGSYPKANAMNTPATHPKIYANGAKDTRRLIDLIQASGLRSAVEAKHVFAFARPAQVSDSTV